MPKQGQDKNTATPKFSGLVERVIEALGVSSQREAARRLGLSDSSISEWKREGFISIDNLLKIVEYSNASINWLLTGKGPKFTTELLKGEFKNPYHILINEQIRDVILGISEREEKPIVDISNDLLIEALGARGEVETRIQTILRYEHFGMHSERLIAVRLLGTIAAGRPIEVFEEEEIAWIDKDLVIEDRTYVLRVRGDSMIDEGILDGDLIVCLRSEGAYNGQRVIALIEGEGVTLKTFYQTGNVIRLQPANPMYKPIILPAERVRIQGIVTAIQRRM